MATHTVRGGVCAVLLLAGAAGQATGADVEAVIQHGDVLFNQADYAGARKRYQHALKQVRDDPARRSSVCELKQNLAAVYQAEGDGGRFYTLFKEADRCTRELDVRLAGQAGNLLIGGDFEDGLVPPWGTGHYEYSGGETAFGIWWNSLNARAFMKTDTDRPHGGRRALRITNYSPAAPHVFTTTSQRIRGLKPNTVYQVTLAIKAQNLSPGAVFFVVDAAWTKALPSVPAGTYDWQPYSATINIGHNDYIDFRVIQVNTGTVWLDDIVVQPATEIENAQTLLQQAESLFDQARFDEAAQAYGELQKRFADDGGVQWQAQRQLGRIHLAIGQYEKALAELTPLAERGLRPLPLDIGDLHFQLGEYAKAKDWYDKGLVNFKGDQGTTSLVLERLAATYLALGDLASAARAQERALLILRHIGDRHGEAVGLTTLGRIHLRRDDYSRAEGSCAEAVTLARQLDDRQLLSTALRLKAEAAWRAGHHKTARTAIDEALNLGRTIADRRGEVESLYLRARLRRDAGHAGKALADFRAAAQRLNEIYTRLGGMPGSTRRAFLDQFEGFYSDYLDLLLEQYRDKPAPGLATEAFRVAEEARARAFTEMIAETRADQALAATSHDPRFVKLLAKEHAARLSIAELERRRSRLRGDDAGAAREALDRLTAAAEQEASGAFAALAKAYPQYAELRHPAAPGIEETQALLGDDEALVAFFVTAHRTGIWAVTRNAAELSVLAEGRDALASRTLGWLATLTAPVEAYAALAELPPIPTSFKSLDEYNAAMAPRRAAWERLAQAFAAFDADTAHALYQELIGPAGAQIAGKHLIYLVPHDFLYRLPFEALLSAPPPIGPRDGQPAGDPSDKERETPFWVRNQALAYLPGANVLRSLHSIDRETKPGRAPLVAFADPVFDGEQQSEQLGRTALLSNLRAAGALRESRLPRLTDTADEARYAARILEAPEANLYLRERASEYNVKRLPLEHYRYLLFATHGLLAGEFGPGVQPALALSFVGDPDNDGLLEMGEVLGLDLNADLVVLSACNTARAEAGNDRGEGFAGLARAFMYAGADALAVTLWSIQSQAAEQLMSNFYGRLARTPRAQALADAKRAMIEGGQRFVVDDENRIVVSASHPFFWAPFILVGAGK